MVGLASNAIRKNVSMIINELGIYDHFDSVICGDEVTNGKPNPEMFNESIDRFNISKSECLIFEDSIGRCCRLLLILVLKLLVLHLVSSNKVLIRCWMCYSQL